MFLRTINDCTEWLATLIEEPEEYASARAKSIGRLLLLTTVSLGLAAGIVALTTVIALGLDALIAP